MGIRMFRKSIGAEVVVVVLLAASATSTKSCSLLLTLSEKDAKPPPSSATRGSTAGDTQTMDEDAYEMNSTKDTVSSVTTLLKRQNGVGRKVGTRDGRRHAHVDVSGEAAGRGEGQMHGRVHGRVAIDEFEDGCGRGQGAVKCTPELQWAMCAATRRAGRLRTG